MMTLCHSLPNAYYSSTNCFTLSPCQISFLKLYYPLFATPPLHFVILLPPFVHCGHLSVPFNPVRCSSFCLCSNPHVAPSPDHTRTCMHLCTDRLTVILVLCTRPLSNSHSMHTHSHSNKAHMPLHLSV